jgi:N6-adenosine-specific RNA methylase IME4
MTNMYEGFKGLARVVVMDLPWAFSDQLPGSGRGAAKHYNTQSIESAKSTPLPPMEDDCVLFFWRVAAFSAVSYEIIEALGFTYKTEIAWFKRNECGRCKGSGNARVRRYVEQKTIPLSDAKERVYDGMMETFCPNCDGKGEKDHIGMGRIVRGAHEICLVAVRGKANQWVCDKGVRSVFDTIAESEIVAPVREHSEKPDAFYRMVETLFPGPYVEIHARKPRPGWFSVGHQLELATEAAIPSSELDGYIRDNIEVKAEERSGIDTRL